MISKTFRKVHACSVGNFGTNTHKISQWIRANGGEYYKTISTDVTHLICPAEKFRGNITEVEQAKKLGSIHIVSYDWLEDSLLSKTRKPLPEAPYLWENILKDNKPTVQQAKRNEPHVYAAHVKYSRVGVSKSELLTPVGVPLDSALHAFKEGFKKETGKEWDERADGAIPPPKRDSDGKLLPSHEGWFSYDDRSGLLSSFLRQDY
ncbi:hypothetical protein ARAM_002721 [Aspergillus rambellii]|uniref:Uncharacterized protein n=1 Tax=Aspergillus rambellii TaxID=308745 RepID=A0A0F8UMD5_9EURO|nr:hypothetical protein ARAM_002721 [Aspergillus rambellii]